MNADRTDVQHALRGTARGRMGAAAMAASLLLLLAAPARGALPSPKTVSPGSPDGTTLAGRCSVFSWSAVAVAGGYEIVVLELAAEEGRLALRASAPAGASVWVPAADHCLAAGGRYAWAVRALPGGGDVEASPWSAPAFFEVEAAPSAAELAAALAILRRHLEAGRELAPRGVGQTQAGSQPAAPPAGGRGDALPAAAAAPSRLGMTGVTEALISGSAAIRGTAVETSGEAHGVAATTASPDGAGVAAENTGGGPDLLLAGAVPARLTEAGLDRVSASAESFDFTNSGGGGMTLTVNGAPVLTTATGGDITEVTAGTGLAGGGSSGAVSLAVDPPYRLPQGCADDQLAAWSGTAWTCADAGGGAHDHFGEAWSDSGAPEGLKVTNSEPAGVGLFGQTTSASGAGVVAQGSGTTGHALRIQDGGMQVPGAGVGSSTTVFIHQVTAENTSGHTSIINHPLLNNNPNAILFVTANFNPGGVGGVVAQGDFGVLFADLPFPLNDQWAIYNQNETNPPPVGASFNVIVVRP